MSDAGSGPRDRGLEDGTLRRFFGFAYRELSQ